MAIPTVEKIEQFGDVIDAVLAALGAPTVANFTGYTWSYIYSGASLGAAYNVTSNLTASTWQSVGPTDSGADHEWSDIDILPDNAVAITVGISISVPRVSSTTDTVTGSIQARRDSSMGAITGPQAKDRGSVDAPTEATAFAIIDIPLTESKTFELNYGIAGNSNPGTITMQFLGFKSNVV